MTGPQEVSKPICSQASQLLGLTTLSGLGPGWSRKSLRMKTVQRPWAPLHDHPCGEKGFPCIEYRLLFQIVPSVSLPLN